MLTVSKALLISRATVMVRAGGLFWLNPVAMVLLSWCSAVSVECLLLYPCCVEICGMLVVMYGSNVFSSVFATTERSEIGLYDVPMFMSLLGLGMGMMLASFHACGMMLSLRASVYSCVRKVSPRGPMCFRCLMLILSGPVVLLFLLFWMASWTCVVVSCSGVVWSVSMCLSVALFVLSVVCLTVLVNCLLNEFASCDGVVAVLLLNEMVLLGVGLGFLFPSPCIVCQSVCVFCL